VLIEEYGAKKPRRRGYTVSTLWPKRITRPDDNRSSPAPSPYKAISVRPLPPYLIPDERRQRAPQLVVARFYTTKTLNGHWWDRKPTQFDHFVGDDTGAGGRTKVALGITRAGMTQYNEKGRPE